MEACHHGSPCVETQSNLTLYRWLSCTQSAGVSSLKEAGADKKSRFGAGLDPGAHFSASICTMTVSTSQSETQSADRTQMALIQ